MKLYEDNLGNDNNIENIKQNLSILMLLET